MLWPFVVDRTSMLDTEWARLSPPDRMPTDLDLQPAVAASRAAAAGPARHDFLLASPMVLATYIGRVLQARATNNIKR
jgi:hypothetical protein